MEIVVRIERRQNLLPVRSLEVEPNHHGRHIGIIGNQCIAGYGSVIFPEACLDIDLSGRQ